jgi:hypothetical protein
MIDKETVLRELTNQKRFVRAGSEEDKTLDSAIALIKINSGEWIDIWNADDPDTSDSGRCSLCNRISSRPLGEYCRWCGAYMGGDYQ